MKDKKTQSSKMSTVVFRAFVIVWLIAITAFTVWAWQTYIWQAKVDNDAIYKLTVENAQQQQTLDELQK